METTKMPGNKDDKPKTVLLFHISQSLFRNKRLKKKRLATKVNTSKTPQKRSKPKTTVQKPVNGYPSPNLASLFSETIEIVSTDEENNDKKNDDKNDEKNLPTPSKTTSELETSIVLSSDDDENELATQARIFPMLTNETTVQTAVGNSVFELSLTQLKQNLQNISKKRKKHKDSKRPSKRLTNPNISGDLSISLLSDDDE